jgi:Putative 2OG-Fe(II) oxygenase
MLCQVFDHTIYQYQDQDFINYAESWFDGSADLHWTNDLRSLRSTGDLDQIYRFCLCLKDYFFVNFITSHANIFLQTHFQNISESAVLIGIWPFAMSGDLRHAPHNHPDSVLSGTYYVDVPTGSSPILFHRNNETVGVEPSSGTLLIWSSDLVHSVEKVNGPVTRKAISFDLALALR